MSEVQREIEEVAILIDGKPIEKEAEAQILSDVQRSLRAEQRWPDVEFDPIRGQTLKEDWDYAGECFDAIEFKFPRRPLAPGPDYPNVLFFIKNQCGLSRDTELFWENDRIEIVPYVPDPVVVAA